MRVLAIFFALFLAPSAFAQTSIQDRPQILADVDVYKMEAEAEAAWKESLPKLKRVYSDYVDAWHRLQQRLQAANLKWFVLKEKAMYGSPVAQRYDEMNSWCGNLAHRRTPNSVEENSMLFAQLDVRVKLCEEKLPPESAPKAVAPSQKKKR